MTFGFPLHFGSSANAGTANNRMIKSRFTLSRLGANSQNLRSQEHYFFGGKVSPNTEIIPCPATLILSSAGAGR